MKANENIRQAIFLEGVKCWQVADALGIADATLSRLLRYELPSDKQANILKIIQHLKYR